MFNLNKVVSIVEKNGDSATHLKAILKHRHANLNSKQAHIIELLADLINNADADYSNFSEKAFAQSFYNWLDYSVISKALHGQAATADVEKALRQVVLVSAFSGEKQGKEKYSVAEWAEVVKKPVNIEPVRALLTLGSQFHEKGVRDYLPGIFLLLTDNTIDFNKVDDFEKILVLSSCLFVVWDQLPFLEYDEQVFLMQNYFILSHIIGVPVRQILAEYIYGKSYNMTVYLTFSEFLIKCLDGNIEVVPKEILGKEFNLNQSVAEHVNEKGRHGRPNVGSVKMHLHAAIETAALIKDVNLIKGLEFEEQTENRKYEDEMRQLILWFFFEKIWYRIFEYFKNPNCLVKLKAFLMRLIESNRNVTEKDIVLYASFNEFLIVHKLIKPNNQFFVFDETTANFQFNDTAFN